MSKLFRSTNSRFAKALKSSFRVRLFIGIAAVILIVSAAFASLLFYQQYRTQLDKRTSEGTLLAKLLARDVRLAVFAGERDQINNAINWAMAMPEVQAIDVFDRAGNLLVRQAKPLEQNVEYDEFRSFIPGLLNKNLEKSLIVGMQWGGDAEASVGSVRVTINESESTRRLHRLIIAASLTTLLLLAIGIIAAFRLADSMARPLTQLTACVTALKDGDDSVRATVDTDDEIGELAAIFNSMVEAIKIRSKDLEEALEELYQMNISLEEKVAKRTEQLENANRELESFNYSASHDLRAPLTRLEGFCQALREDYSDRLDTQGLYYLERIAATGEQMDRVLAALLTLYQVQQRTMSPRELNISELVQAVAASLRQREPAREITFAIEENVTVYGDMKLLWLALENLIGNAWKFTGGRADARIEFGTALINGELACYLRDNGTGFDMAYYDKLFTPFQRLHNKEDFPGTGIGLAIVQRIISRHGGRIWLESAEGKGTTCYFVLPQQSANETVTAEKGV